MSLNYQIPSGQTFEVEGHNKTGLLTQDPQFTKATNSFLTNDGDKIVASGLGLEIFAGTHKLAADGTSTITFLNKDATHKRRIVAIGYYLRTERTGGTPDTDLTVSVGDGAASEAFSTVGTVDLDGDALDTLTFLTVNDANQLIDVNKSLKSELVVGGTTTGGTALLDVYVLTIRCKA